MSQSERGTSQTKQKLMDAFWQLYCKNDIRDITVREITQLAGYNRGTFYTYFKDVYDVLEQIEYDLFVPFEERGAEYKDIGDYLNNVNYMEHLKFCTQLFMEKGDYIGVLLGKNGDPKFVERFKQRIKDTSYKHLCDAGQSDKIVTDYFFEYYVSAVVGVLTSWYERGKDIPVEKLLALLYNLSPKDLWGRENYIVDLNNLFQVKEAKKNNN